MSIVAHPSTRRAWSKALDRPAQEFSLTSLPILAGSIPEGLRGTLYRNGPGRLQRGGDRAGHWFDGDGAILAVHFTKEGALGVYRYVQTQGYRQEAENNAFLFPNYGMTAPGPFWNTWTRKIKNAANTSVLALPDKLLALWEGGNPHALDLKSLVTWGMDDLSALPKGAPFSAHPKVDPRTGEIYNFGIAAGLNATLNLYLSEPTGKIIKTGSIELEGLPLIHDFVMAGPYLLFFVPPVRVNLLPAALGISSFSDSMAWKPELGTQLIVVDRETFLVVSRGEAAPWFQWHFANGYVDEEGAVIVEIVRYEDFSTNQNLKEIGQGKINTPAKGTLWQMRLNPKTGRLLTMEQLGDRGCDFPVVPKLQVSQPWRYTYLAVHRDTAYLEEEIFGAIARYDRLSGCLEIADMGENCYPSEPIVTNALNSPDWVITVVYDGNADASEVRVYDCDRLESEPVCRLGLPSVVPPSFHGAWKPIK